MRLKKKRKVRMNLSRILGGLLYSVRHSLRILGLAWFEKEYHDAYLHEKNFRREYLDICIPFEDLLSKMHLRPSLVNFSSTKMAEGSIHSYEVLVLCSLVKATKSRMIFEMGTFMGQTSYNMSENTPKNGKIYTLDINQRLDKTEKIIPINMDSQCFDFSSYYSKIDLAFIDGNHSYPYVLSDSENMPNCVKDRGFIVWHDFSHDHLLLANAIFDFCATYYQRIFWIDGTRLAICRVNGPDHTTPQVTRKFGRAH